KPSASTRLALLALPLASTVNRRPIRIPREGCVRLPPYGKSIAAPDQAEPAGGHMANVNSHNPTGRFTGLADLYARHRPNYPAAATDRVMTRCCLGPDTLLVDVGCGTGISSRLFAARGVPVLGIDPNDDMRARAEADPTPC